MDFAKELTMGPMIDNCTTMLAGMSWLMPLLGLGLLTLTGLSGAALAKYLFFAK